MLASWLSCLALVAGQLASYQRKLWKQLAAAVLGDSKYNGFMKKTISCIYVYFLLIALTNTLCSDDILKVTLLSE